MSEDLSSNPGCLWVFLRLFGLGGARKPAAAQSLPYRLRDDFLSPAELSFHRVLSEAVGKDAAVCPKVNLADIFFVVRPNENQSHRNRIAQKHVDFLICRASSMRPIVGVELDDSSHRRSDRQARDEFLNQVFEAAGLPLVHVPARSNYRADELSVLLAPHLAGSPADAQGTATGPASAPDAAAGPPLCPKCGIPMALRTSTRGERPGEQFYGCPNYPKCRQVLPIQ